MYDEKINNPWKIVFDEAEGEANGSTDTGGDTGDTNTGDASGDKLFTQEEVNTIIQKRVSRHKDEQSKMVEDLERLRNSQNLSSKEREGLNARLTSLQRTLETKEETATRERGELVNQHTEALTAAQDDVKKWRSLHTNSTIENALLSAAQTADAFSAGQIATLLRGQTELVEDRDAEGKPTGDLVPRVSYPGKDSEGVSITLDLTVTEAIDRMKKDATCANLFKSGATGGVGGNTDPDGNSTEMTVEKLAGLPPEQFAAWREKHDLSELRN